ncbi:PadR family transcriptional regulator [Glaciihabitans tibetensis]|uniref:PadR family transcriptional regulator n=1 Tax=Glaciihabitans tibetensis TaxID=1266600 RepID=A0A2T0V3E2_9MICO|nr:PadR family transcriptional regulator [Glaciihabitans tibetensis]PRY64674.1 PadR family transcriptional regulator [Glaciihabitans tibetensis]
MAATELREPTFWVLTALASGRRHGYALIQETRELSDGRVNLKVATLYAALDRLGTQGLVASDGDEVIDGRLRRYFRLTDAGAQRLADEITRLEANAREATARLKLRPLSLVSALSSTGSAFTGSETSARSARSAIYTRSARSALYTRSALYKRKAAR